jgi:hypothetical protein
MRLLALTVALAVVAVAAAPAAALEIRPLPGRTVEGNQVQFAVIFGPDDPYTVELVPAGGTASPGTDFATDPVVARGGPYEGLRYDEVWVDTEWDDVAEGEETLRLQTRDGAVSGTATIQDRDPGKDAGAWFPGGYAQVDERAGALRIPLEARGEGPFTVDYRTVDGVALAGRDYVATSGRLNLPAGDSTHAIEVPIPDNAINDRYVKAFYVLLTGDEVHDAVLRARVVDDDHTRMVVEPVTVREGDGPTTVRVPVRLTTPSSSIVSAPVVPDTGWTPNGAGALPGADFVERVTRVTFAPGVTEAFAEIELIGDDVLEGAEPLNIHHPWGIQSEQVEGANITVEDDDAADVATAAGRDLLALGAPALLGERTVGVAARCLRPRGSCAGRVTFSANGRASRRPLRVAASRGRTLRFALPRGARRVKVAATVRDGAGRTGRATASALLRGR